MDRLDVLSQKKKGFVNYGEHAGSNLAAHI